MTTQIMIDLETLDNRPTSVVTQIGLVAFNKEGVISGLQIYVDPDDCQKHGMTISADTVKWWLSQSKEAQEHFKIKGDRVIPALTQVIDFFRQHCTKDSGVWGNGAAFDNVILRNMFECIDTEAPWKFWQDMCYRTIKNKLKQIPADDFGTKHVALDDAQKQALHLIKIAAQTGGFPL